MQSCNRPVTIVYITDIPRVVDTSHNNDCIDHWVQLVFTQGLLQSREWMAVKMASYDSPSVEPAAYKLAVKQATLIGYSKILYMHSS